MFRFLVVFFICVLPAVSFGMGQVPNSSSQEAGAGRVAADFTLPTTAGNNKSLAQMRDGKRAVLFFWATWCPHCHEELEKVRQNLDAIQKKGIVVILVNTGESVQEAKMFLKKQGVSLESFADDDNTVTGQYSVIGIPSLFFIDEKGIVRSVDHEFPIDYTNRFDSK